MSNHPINTENNLFVQRAKAVLRSKKYESDTAGIQLISELEAELELCWQRTAVEEVWQTHWRKFKLQGLEAADVFEIKVFLADYFEGQSTRIEIREEAKVVAASVDMGGYQLEAIVPVTPAALKKARRPKQYEFSFISNATPAPAL